MTELIKNPIASSGWADYELIDSGNNRKLERFGTVVLDRFEPDAPWSPAFDASQWDRADFSYSLKEGATTGSWKKRGSLQNEWTVNLDQLQIALKLTESRHIGIFPEQLENWRWMESIIRDAKKPTHVLNLFAYTGIASLFCAYAGAEVTHVDASRAAIDTAKESQTLSNLDAAPIRWIVDDVRKFVEREIRRGNRYHGIILDPPLFGRGPKGEVWKFDHAIGDLLSLLDQLFSDAHSFFLLTAYNNQYTQNFLANLVENKFKGFNGTLQYGPLVQVEKSAGRELKQAEYVRFAAG